MIPIPPKLTRLARNLYWRLLPTMIRRRFFKGSGDYWEKRYEQGGNSGAGSYGRFARFKADVINSFVKENGVRSVIEFGCGDGNQLSLAEYPEYLGIDVSVKAVELCRARFKEDASKSFLTLDDYKGETADLALSLDVIYHLVEDEVYDAYMRRLFASAARTVVLYSSDTDDNSDIQGPHIRHRKFSLWIAQNTPEWKLVKHLPNPIPYEGDGTRGSFAEFHFYERGKE